MEVNIGELSSTVHATDSGALLAPGVLRTIVEFVSEHLDAERRDAESMAEEQRIRPITYNCFEDV